MTVGFPDVPGAIFERSVFFGLLEHWLVVIVVKDLVCKPFNLLSTGRSYGCQVQFLVAVLESRGASFVEANTKNLG